MRIDCSTGEVVYNYKDYLQTKHWQNKRSQFKKEFNYECVMCGSTKNGLHIHHMTYQNIGKEKLDDLCYLCSDCHTKLHNEIDKLTESKVLKFFRNKKQRKKCKKKIDKKGKYRYNDYTLTKEEKAEIKKHNEKILKKKKKNTKHKEEKVSKASKDKVGKLCKPNFDTSNLTHYRNKY